MLFLGLYALLFNVLPRATHNKCLNDSKKGFGFFFTLIVAEVKKKKMMLLGKSSLSHINICRFISLN